MTIRPAIPQNKNAITVAWMQQALAAGGAVEVPTIADIAVEDIGAGFGLMGEILRCHLTYAERSASSPDTVIVKLPSSHEKTLRLSKRLQLYKREYMYYRHLARHVPLRSPTLLFGDFDDASHRFVLVLEDLRAMPMRDQIAGASETDARRAIRGIAKLHGSFWNKTDHSRLSGFYKVLDPKYRPILQIVYLVNLLPTLRNFGKYFSKELSQIAEKFGPRFADYISDMAVGPQTLTHGDFRLENIFYGDDEQDEISVIDWQVSGINSPLYDVSYFLSSSVTTEVRRKVEHESLAEYHDIVCSMGARDFTLDDCWQLYRKNTLGCLLVMVIVCGALSLDTDRSRALAEVELRRTLKAIEDLDAAEFLPAPRPFLSIANIFSASSRSAFRIIRALRQALATATRHPTL